jgi:hypothetical protein
MARTRGVKRHAHIAARKRGEGIWAMDLTLITIVVGFGLTELLLRFEKLFTARRRVDWDALPLAWALIALVAVVNYWWGIRDFLAHAAPWPTGIFMAVMVSPVFLYLTCAAALPRIAAGETLDMKAAYAEERAAFLCFFLAYQCGNWLLDIIGLGAAPMITIIHRAAVCVALGVALIARSRRWDWIAAAVVAAAYILRLVTQTVH